MRLWRQAAAALAQGWGYPRYERNKHIFPASRWEVYDPNKSYGSYTIHGPGGSEERPSGTAFVPHCLRAESTHADCP